MTNKTKIIKYIILTVLLALIVFLVGVFSSSTVESNKVGGLRVYNTDGTITTIGNESTNSSIKSASHSSLLNNSTVYNVVIFICFQDENPATVFTNTITSNIYNKFMGNSNSLKDYYLSLSYGSFSVDSLFALRDKENNVYFVYQDIYTRSHYTSIKTQNGTKRYNAEAPLLNRALTAADAYLDYTGIDLDLNNDNYVDSVSFVVSGKFSSLAWGELMWPHKWLLNTISKACTNPTTSSTLNNLQVEDYTFTFANAFELGLITHEFGHLIGMPDLYHTTYDTSYIPVGYWDLMASNCDTPQYTLTYTRQKYLGFVNDAQVVEITMNGTYSLKPTIIAGASDKLAYRLSLNEYETLWIEYRQNRTGTYEYEIPGSGLIIYRTNSKATGNETAKHNKKSYPEEIFIYRPNISTKSSIGEAEEENLSYAYLSPNNPHFSSLGNATITTTYASKCIYLSDGTNTGIVITATEQTDDLITFTIDIGSYAIGGIKNAYIEGQKINGTTVSGAHYMYYQESYDSLGVSLYVLFNNRKSYTRIPNSNLNIEFENKICPEGETATITYSYIGSDSQQYNYEYVFVLYIYDLIDNIEVISQPTKTSYSVGQTLNLNGLAIRINYASSNIQDVTYSESNKDKWTIVDGLDMDTRGTYSHVQIKYGSNIYFYITSIIVGDTPTSIFIDERNTKHIDSDTQTPVFSVYARYSDNTSSPLEKTEYTIAYNTSQLNSKNTIKITLKSNTSLFTESYVFILGAATITNINTVVTSTHTYDYGNTPNFINDKLEISFSNGFSISGPDSLNMNNYYDELVDTYNSTSSSKQRLNCVLDNTAFYVDVLVLSPTPNVLSSKNANLVSISNKNIILNSSTSLLDFSSTLSSYLGIAFKDNNDFDITTNANSGRMVGTGYKLILKSDDGTEAITYNIYLLGDGNGDGLFDDKDIPFITKGILDEDSNLIQYDYNRDGQFTLTDFVSLINHLGGN